MVNIKYINSAGEVIHLNNFPYFLQTGDLRDYAWNYRTKNEYNPRIYAFDRNMIEKTVSIAVISNTKKAYNSNCNRLLEVFEKDIYSVNKGRIVIDDYYMEGYFVARKVNEWYPSRIITNEYSFISESGKWLKDVYKVFNSVFVVDDSENTGDGKMHPSDFKFDFAPASAVSRLVSDSFVPFDFEIVFTGPINFPKLIAGGNIYRVYTNVGEGETLTINSRNKTVIKTKLNGEKINEFHKRDRDNNIFQKMPATNGSTYINCPDCIVSIRAYTERSEPKWI